jgi:hypothetical protein
MLTTDMKRTSISAALSVLFGLSLAASVAVGARPPQPPPIRFNRDIRPILSENCFACHGPDRATRAAGLRLDIESAAKSDRDGHAAVVPGSPEKSVLFQRITAHGADAGQMPPPSSGKSLKPAEIALLRRWIAEGAKWEGHWAYLPVTRSAPPTPKNTKWARGPIDRFLLARMEREGMSPSPEADRRTLLRRLSLDLTGLPPRPEEVRAFLADKRPDAYERQVSRLLASPHYGERMAQYWLDLVRYADTVGYHGDQNVSVWPFRDYVIRSFNRNTRFDTFTREQLAGDLLPHAGTDQLVASGYNRLGMMSTEGGIQDKEYRAKYATDRVKNASGVWMGATLACAECHDHKFDPYAQKDFYRFAAFFADLDEKGFYNGGGAGDWGPKLHVLTDAQKAKLASLDVDLDAARKGMTATTDDALAAGRARWEAEVRAADAANRLTWDAPKPTAVASSGGSTLKVNADASVLVGGKLPAWDTYTAVLPLPAGRRIGAIRLEALSDESLPGNGISRAGYYFVLSEFEVSIRRGSGPWEPVRFSGVRVNAEEEGYPGLATIDGRADTGWAKVYGAARTAVFRLASPLTNVGPDTQFRVRLRHETAPRLAIGKFRVSFAESERADLSAKTLPDNALAAVRKDAAARTPDEVKLIAEFYRGVAAPELDAARDRLARVQAERSLLLGRAPQTLISKRTEQPRTVRVLPRGNWMDDSGEVVQPGVPQFLLAKERTGNGAAAPVTRKDLADWLVSRENPLTARVFVNRLWKLFYGGGLAKNLDDFGAQGEAPVHAELLDWLAAEFMDSGWDVKHLVRLMVTTSAYRQTSAVTPALLARDPFNRFYARQSAFRLDAEFVRDAALSAAGLLSPRVGGPSVKPYQPTGYYAALNFPKREYAIGAGEALYRRGLYTHWQRTFVHPALVAFDAPSREECTVSRTVSNTPMQALVLLNDPEYVEAARVLAARAVREAGPSFDARLSFAYERVLGRAPRAEEAAVLRRLYHRTRARYAADRKSASRLTTVGDAPAPKVSDPAELAAWTSVTRALLNLHETITRD